MKVHELIAKLAKFPREQEIVVLDGNNGMFMDLGGVWEEYFDESTLTGYDLSEDVEGLDVIRVVVVSVE